MQNNVFTPLYAAGFNYYLKCAESRFNMILGVFREGLSVEREVDKNVLLNFRSDNIELGNILQGMISDWSEAAKKEFAPAEEPTPEQVAELTADTGGVAVEND